MNSKPNTKPIFAATLAALLCTGAAMAQDIPAKKQTKAGLYLTSQEAVEMLQDESVLFVDVRSRAEVSFLGLPTRVDVHIPIMVMPTLASYNAEKQTYNLVQNPDFAFDFEMFADEHAISPDKKIVLICRSGSRSAKAANQIYDLGFHNVYSIVDGYEGDKIKDGPHKGHRELNGWKTNEFEWTYSISPDQAYPADKL